MRGRRAERARESQVRVSVRLWVCCHGQGERRVECDGASEDARGGRCDRGNGDEATVRRAKIITLLCGSEGGMRDNCRGSGRCVSDGRG